MMVVEPVKHLHGHWYNVVQTMKRVQLIYPYIHVYCVYTLWTLLYSLSRLTRNPQIHRFVPVMKLVTRSDIISWTKNAISPCIVEQLLLDCKALGHQWIDWCHRQVMVQEHRVKLKWRGNTARDQRMQATRICASVCWKSNIGNKPQFHNPTVHAAKCTLYIWYLDKNGKLYPESKSEP